MKIIGTFPRAKGWVVHYNKATGAVYGDYNEPIGLNEQQIADRVKRSLAILAANPTRPTDMPEHPGWNYNSRDPESIAAWQAKANAHNAARDLQRNYDAALEQQHWACFDKFAPVFREVATFVGYTRGRSSVTMQFRFADGSTLEIGPSGIDKFIQGIQDGHIIRKNGGFDLTFRMEKKGANVYMWPMYTEEDFKGMAPYEDPDA